MDTVTDDISGSNNPTRNAELSGMLRCKRCSLNYTPGRSTSSLRLTYCSFLCELGDLGFSMDGLESMEPPKGTAATPQPDPPTPVTA
ncbi:MAG: hypothetical protein ACSLFM_01410 [Tepidiformaceae bacterium]